MSPLEQLRAHQRPNIRTQADEAFEAFLAECSPTDVVLDLAPITAIELRHLAHVKGTA